MARIRYGFAEYEDSRSPNRPSMWHLRSEFLQSLIRLRRAQFMELLRFVNLSAFGELNDRFSPDHISHFVFSALFQGNPRKVEIIPTATDTPVNIYCSILRSIGPEIEAKVAEIRGRNGMISNSTAKERAMQEFVGSWESLESLPITERFRELVIEWAADRNILTPWFLDCLLSVFTELCDHLLTKVGTVETFDSGISEAVTYSYNERVATVLRDCVHDFERLNVFRRIFDVDPQDPAQVRFELKHGKIEQSFDPWSPTLESRKEFELKIKERFGSWRGTVVELSKYPRPFDISDTRIRLEAHCNDVESSPDGQEPNPHVESFVSSWGYELSLISARWDGDRESRVAFIDGYIRDLEARVRWYKSVSEELSRFRAGILDEGLYAYCNRVERGLPDHFVKNPEKNDPYTHFDWLVRFQVPPCEGYSEIASSSENISKDGVKRALSRLSKTLGLDLRKEKRGRPRGRRGLPVPYSAGRSRK